MSNCTGWLSKKVFRAKENDIYPLTATLSVNAFDPDPRDVNLKLTVQWASMDGFPKRSFFYVGLYYISFSVDKGVSVGSQRGNVGKI